MSAQTAALPRRSKLLAGVPESVGIVRRDVLDPAGRLPFSKSGGNHVSRGQFRGRPKDVAIHALLGQTEATRQDRQRTERFQAAGQAINVVAAMPKKDADRAA